MGRSFLPGRVIRLIWSSSFVPYDSSVRQEDRDYGISYIVIGGVLLGVFVLINYLVISPIFETMLD